jgi:hypothetical protein
MNGNDTPTAQSAFSVSETDAIPRDWRVYGPAIGISLERHARGLVTLLACAALLFLAGAVIVEAVRERLIDAPRATYLLLLVVAFTVSAGLFVSSILDEGRIYIESHWGGIGGGLGGWRVSRSLVFLVTTAVTFALTADALNERVGPDLRERYRAALNLAGRQRMRCEDRGIVERKLVLQCAPPSDAVYDRFWDQIKLANGAADDIVVIRAVAAGPTGTAPAAQTPTAPTPSPAPAAAGGPSSGATPSSGRGN